MEFFTFGNMKKVLFLPLIVLLWKCQSLEVDTQRLVDLVPPNTTVVFQVNDFSIVKNSLANQPLLSHVTPLWKELKNTIENMDSQSIEAPALFCLTPLGQSETAVSVIYKSTIPDSLQPPLGTNTLVYSGQVIERISAKPQTLFKTKMGRVTFLSDSQITIENSIRNFKNKSKGIQEKTFFKLTEGIDKNAPLNLFIHSKASALLSAVFPKTPLFPKIKNHWAAYDFNTKRDPFTLDGIIFVNDLLPQELSVTKDLKPQALQTPQLIPSVFTSYLALSVSNVKTLEDNFKTLVRFRNMPLKTVDFTAFSSVDEIAWLTQKDEKAVIFHTVNPEAFPFKIDQKAQKQYRSIPYSKKTLPKAMAKLVAVFGSEIGQSWVFQWDDFFVFAESEKMLQFIINGFKDGKVLENEPNFKALEEGLADKSSFLWIGGTPSLQDFWAQQLDNKVTLLEKLPSKMYPYVAFQAVAEKGFVQIRLTAQKDEAKNPSSTGSAQYNFVLDAPVATAPQWLKNHRTKALDIAVQDANNVLYLFSNTGTLFWKKQLPGKIAGPIQQVDLYRNKRLQMAFRTKDRMMILDRNGKIVPPFDIKIPSTEVIQPLAVFDYNANRNYRFLLNQGTTISMLDGKGKSVKGFELKKLESNLLSPPKHVRIKGKDYLLFQQVNGSLKITDRRGRDRVNPKQRFDFSKNPVYLYYNTFTITDKSGHLIQIDTNGNVVKTPLDLDADHRVDMTSRSLVTLSKNNLNIKGIPVTLPDGEYTAPKIFYLNDTLFIAVTNRSQSKIYLYYSNGKLVKGFPVYGTSSIALDNADGDRALELVTQSGENGLLIYEVLR